MTLIRTISLAVAFVLGIVVALNTDSTVPPALLQLLAVSGAIWAVAQGIKERTWKETSTVAVILAAALTGFSLGFWRTQWHAQADPASSLKTLLESMPDDARIEMQGVIAAEPELRSNRGELNIQVQKVRPHDTNAWQPVENAKILLRIYPEWGGERDARKNPRLHKLLTPDAYGWTLSVEATTRPPKDVLNFGAFDMEQFLTRQGYAAQLSCSVHDVQILEKSRGNPVTEFAFWVKKRFIQTYKTVIRAPASRLVSATTLGTRRAVEGIQFRGHDITETFRHAGVGHVLAVSGLHVSIISILLYSLLRLAGLRPKVFVPVLIAFLIVLALLTGARPSSIRAVIMNSIILIAFAYCSYNLRQATYVGLSLSAIFILTLNPLTLFDPSFMLSFGAVLSLVLIAPTFDRWLQALRGFSLLFATLWFIALIGIACVRLDLLLAPMNTAALAGALWLAILAGARLNDRHPAAWKTGLDRVPKPLRMFGAAQLAIQIGMMIPLSAWFFGRFPVAGILVNLFAIPAVGIVVQLGMLTGLAGLIPGVGIFLAMPFGATATVVGYLFFWMAHSGASLFPFPATPKPTLDWMVAYYTVVGLVLLLDTARNRIRGVVYRNWPAAAGNRILRRLPWILPCLLIAAAPLSHWIKPPPKCKAVVVMATKNYPAVLFAMDDRQAVAVNAGNEFFGGHAMFETIRRQGATRLRAALITGAHPEIGSTGLAALAKTVPVATLYLPVAADTAAEFMQKLGDSYVLEQIRIGKPWALDYKDGIHQLLERIRNSTTQIQSLANGVNLEFGDLTLKTQPLPAHPETQYISSAKTAVVRFETGSIRGVIVTDGMTEWLEHQIPEDAPPCDVLVVSDLSYRKSYLELLDRAVELTRPTVVIIAGDEPMNRMSPENWAKNHPSIHQIFHTAADGAVSIQADPNGQITFTTALKKQYNKHCHPIIQEM